MSLRYLKSLLIRGASLQEAIEREQSRPHPDRIRLLQLKKIRLEIRDRLERLSRPAAGPLQLAPARAMAAPRGRPSRAHRL
jgi:hypothetical protein